MDDPLADWREPLQRAPRLAPRQEWLEQLPASAPARPQRKVWFAVAGILALAAAMLLWWNFATDGVSNATQRNESNATALASAISTNPRDLLDIREIWSRQDQVAVALVDCIPEGKSIVCHTGDTVVNYHVQEISVTQSTVTLTPADGSNAIALAVTTVAERNAWRDRIAAGAMPTREELNRLALYASHGDTLAHQALATFAAGPGTVADYASRLLQGGGATLPQLIAMASSPNRRDRPQLLSAVLQDPAVTATMFITQRLQDPAEPLREFLLEEILQSRQADLYHLVRDLAQQDPDAHIRDVARRIADQLAGEEK